MQMAVLNTSGLIFENSLVAIDKMNTNYCLKRWISRCAKFDGQ
jgi:hypothetical protein